MRIGVIKEGKVPHDERVPLTPQQCVEISKKYPSVDIVVQASDVRRIKNEEYEAVGVKVVDSVADCDVLLGVKEVPIDHLIHNKTYFFFSHTIKKQPYNRKLLKALIDKNIRMVDYEVLTNKLGVRLIGFGRYAGLVGAYNGIRAFGLRNELFELKKAHECHDLAEMEAQLQTVKLPAIKIVLTGRGRVGKGAREILELMRIREVGKDDFLKKTFDEPVFVNLNTLDYNKRIDGNTGTLNDFTANPHTYKSAFFRFAKVADIYMAGHLWKTGSPIIFAKEDIASAENRVRVVADISCDIDGPVGCTIRPSTIDAPLYGYHPLLKQEVVYNAPDAITVMAVDNLPCELPRDASEGFGKEFISKVLSHLVGIDEDETIARATICKNGALTQYFSYLQNYLDGNE